MVDNILNPAAHSRRVIALSTKLRGIRQPRCFQAWTEHSTKTLVTQPKFEVHLKVLLNSNFVRLVFNLRRRRHASKCAWALVNRSSILLPPHQCRRHANNTLVQLNISCMIMHAYFLRTRLAMNEKQQPCTLKYPCWHHVRWLAAT